jgi:alpha-ribazole phosphatase/probable phosphoglycerate mutase
LREINFGQVSGLTEEGFRQAMPTVYAHWQERDDLTFQFPGGEQRHAFLRRVGRALDEIVTRHPKEQVGVVAHGGTIRAGLAHLFPKTMTTRWAYALQNASLTHVRIGKGQNELVVLNDRQHLTRSQTAGYQTRTEPATYCTTSQDKTDS